MNLPELNDNELDVMNLVWREGERSAREVHDVVGERHKWSYSTTRTVLNRMTQKGYLRKVPCHGLTLFQARMGRAAGLASCVRSFARQVLNSDPAPVVSLLAKSEALSGDELDDLVRLLDDTEAES